MARALSPSLTSAVGLVGGFAVARYTKRRELGGAVFLAAGAVSGQNWARRAGPLPAAVLVGLYTAAMGGSHPLAKRVGPWPSVLLVTALTSFASAGVLRRAR